MTIKINLKNMEPGTPKSWESKENLMGQIKEDLLELDTDIATAKDGLADANLERMNSEQLSIVAKSLKELRFSLNKPDGFLDKIAHSNME